MYGSYEPFNKLTAAKGLLKQLQGKWKSYTKPNEEFWEHEWEDHGNCAPGLPKAVKRGPQIAYFDLTVKMYDMFVQKLSQIIGKLKSTKGLKVKTVLDQFRKDLKASVEITCKQRGRISEMHLCMPISTTKDNLKKRYPLVNCNRDLGRDYAGYCGGDNDPIVFN